MTPTTKTVVIVGAGPGGLCAAMLLSARGFNVTVVEAQATIGGRTGHLQLGEYTFDVGSTMLMMPFVLEEMFALAGRRLADELQLMPIDPMYRLDFAGRALDVSSNHATMKESLARFSPGAEYGFDRFIRRESQRLGNLYPVLQHSWPTLTSMLTPAVAAALPHVGIGRSLHAAAAEAFDDPDLQLAFSFQSAYLGMSPWECPAGFGMVPFVEHAWGIAHVRGGVSQICTALARVATQNGARIRTSTKARRLIVENDRCTRVELESGETLNADHVIVNADGTHALLELLNRDVSMRFNRNHLEHLRESCSTYMLYLGLDTVLPLRHNTFYFSNDYEAEMNRVFHLGTLDDDLSLYVCNPSITDPSLAPAGHSALYLLALVPNTSSTVDWEVEGQAMRTRVLEMLARRSGLEIYSHIRTEAALTPDDWEQTYGISHGAVFGPAHSLGQMLAFRLPNRLPSPSNVSLVGGGTSPGSGLPTILESARIATRALCEEERIDFPPARPLPAMTQPLR